MPKSTFEISPTFDRDVRAQIAPVLKEKVADPIVTRAKASAPVGDADDPHAGRYRDSIHTETITNARGEKEIAVVADAPESLDVEYGNEHIEAHATLRRAAGG